MGWLKRRIIEDMEPKEEPPMGTYKAKCDICFEETDVPSYGDWDCPHCHQPYTYDECHQIRLTDAQWEVLRNPSRWIPVTERLPEPYQTVLAFWKDGGIHTSWVTRCGIWEAHFDDGGRDTVNHWMPLPAPPTDAK